MAGPERNFVKHFNRVPTAAEFYTTQTNLRAIAAAATRISVFVADLYSTSQAEHIIGMLGDEGTFFRSLRNELAANPPGISPDSGYVKPAEPIPSHDEQLYAAYLELSLRDS